MQFAARLRRPFSNFFAANAQYRAVPEWWSDMAIGGPDEAQIRIEGRPQTVVEALKLLNYEAEIYGPRGSLVWWGYVNEVEMNFGGTTLSLTLDDVYNAVAVAYVESAADGTIARRTTDWAEDAASISRYGRRELLLSITEGGEVAAQQYRDRMLAQLAAPVPSTYIGTTGAVGATLHCKGHWYRLARRYYLNLAGLEEFVQSGFSVQATGNFYTNTTIAFAEPNRMLDSAHGLGHLSPGDAVLLVGSGVAAHNGWHTVANVISAGEIELETQDIVEEEAGNSVTLSTTSFFAYAVAQPFQLTHADFDNWAARRLALQVQRVGNPTDNLRIDLRADNGGEPADQPLAHAEISGSTLSDAMTWIAADLNTPVTLQGNTTYWIVVLRTGYWDASQHPARLANHYAVSVTEDLSYAHGNVQLASADSWFSRDPAAQMPFRVTGWESTTHQMATLVAQQPDLAGTDLEIESGIDTWQRREGDRLLSDEMDDLIAIGTQDSRRILAQVQPERTVRIFARRDADKPSNLILRADGQIRTVTGQPLEPGQLVAGRWLEAEFLPALDGFTAADALFVERSRYDAESASLSIESEGTESVWQMGVLPG